MKNWRPTRSGWAGTSHGCPPAIRNLISTITSPLHRKKSLRGRPSSTTHFKIRSEEHTSELQSLRHLVCRLLLEKKKIHDSYRIINNDWANGCRSGLWLA